MSPAAADTELAGRGERLAAAAVDALILGVPDVLAVAEVLPESVRLAVAAAAFGVLIWQCAWLTTRGQTVGKRLLGIRIVRRDTGENGGFVTNVLARGVLNGLLNLVPLYFVVDSLFIFRADRLCVHDWIAGTRVVRAAEGAEEPAA